MCCCRRAMSPTGRSRAGVGGIETDSAVHRGDEGVRTTNLLPGRWAIATARGHFATATRYRSSPTICSAGLAQGPIGSLYAVSRTADGRNRADTIRARRWNPKRVGTSRRGSGGGKGETQGLMKNRGATRTASASRRSHPGNDRRRGGALSDAMYPVHYTAVQRGVRIHPTVSELIPTVWGRQRRRRNDLPS